MSVDIGALRKFQDLWGPVLEAIPAVIDAVAKKNDFDRGLIEQKLAFEKAQAEVANVYAQADKYAADANADLERVKAGHAKFMADAAAQRASENDVLAAQQADIKAKLTALNQKVASAQEKLGWVDTEYAAKLTQAQADHAAALAAMEAEIKATEDRRAKAEKALDVLRSKLG